VVLPMRRPGAGLAKPKIHREQPHPRDRMGVGYFQGCRTLIPGPASRDSSKHNLGAPQIFQGNYEYPAGGGL